MSDLIERDKVAELFKELFEQGVLTLIGNDCLQRKLEAIPSTRPKEGKWEYVAQGWHTLRRCSNCKWTQTCSDSKYMGYKYDFCPHCGADMRERKDFQVIVNGNCTKCGKPLSGNRIFICEECEEQSKESE